MRAKIATIDACDLTVGIERIWSSPYCCGIATRGQVCDVVLQLFDRDQAFKSHTYSKIKTDSKANFE